MMQRKKYRKAWSLRFSALLLTLSPSLFAGEDASEKTKAAARPTETAAPVEKAPGTKLDAKLVQARTSIQPNDPGATKEKEERLIKPIVPESTVNAFRDAQLALRETVQAEQEALVAKTEEEIARARLKIEEAKKQLESARTKAVEQLQIAREELKAVRGSLARIQLTPEVRAEVEKKLEKKAAEHEQSREERSQTERSRLKKEHGASLEKPAVKEELGRHAWRVARLRRLLDVAEASEREDLVDRAKALLAQEEKDHQDRLIALEKVQGAAK